MRKYFSFVKFEHTLFSLPIVVAGAMIAASGLPDTRIMLLILCAAAGARTAAMAMNRIIDARFDAENPRTKNREIPTGAVTRSEAYFVTAAGLAVYFSSAYFICPLAFYLSPLPAAVFAAYPYMKRATPLCHFGVGLALALAPIGGWVAVRCSAEDFFAPLMLGLFTFFWVAGFDIIYSIADEEFDRKNDLRSIAVSLGKEKAVSVSTLLHIFSIIPLAALQIREFGGNIFSIWVLLLICAVFALERIKLSETDLAFFKMNVLAGVLVLVFIACGIYLA